MAATMLVGAATSRVDAAWWMDERKHEAGARRGRQLLVETTARPPESTTPFPWTVRNRVSGTV